MVQRLIRQLKNVGKTKEAKRGKGPADDQKTLRQVVSQEIRYDRCKKKKKKGK